MSQGKKIQVSWLTSVMKVSDQRLALGFGIAGGEMRLREQVAHQLQRLAGIDQIIDDQHAFAAVLQKRGLRRFDDLGLALFLVVVAFHRDRIDHADIKLARDHCRRYQSAPRDPQHAAPAAILGPFAIQPPRQRAGIAMQLVPADMKAFFMG